MALLTAVVGGLKLLSELSGAITNITKAISDTKIAGINATTEKERIAADERVKSLEAERDVLIVQWQAQARMVDASISQVNETMREELKPENRHWFFTGWRAAAGWVFVVIAALFGCCLIYATTWDGGMLTRINAAWQIYAAYFGTLAAMVGVYVVARTADKVKGVDTSARAAKP